MSDLLAPTTTIRAVHVAIISAIRSHFDTLVPEVGAYDPMDPLGECDPAKQLRTPAILLELERIDDDDIEASAPGSVAIRCVWVARVILSAKTIDLQIAVRELASAFIALIRETTVDPLAPPLSGNRWGLAEAVGAPEAVSAFPDEFRPAISGYDSWAVSWEQVVYLPEGLPVD